MRRSAIVVFLLTVTLVLAGGVLFACSSTPTEVPIRTFERAQKVDTICLRVFGDNAPEARPQQECAPDSPNVVGANLQYQLFALVTQVSRGEVAVVDLSSGLVVDRSTTVPGINFLPVGAIPTDIATTPDGKMAFVASAEVNKFAIYGIPGHRILGDKAVRPDPDGPTDLASWPVCALPQRPGALAIVTRRPSLIDAGAPANGDADAGVETVPYELVAILPGDRTSPAKLITIDPKPFLRATPRRSNDGTPLDDFGPGPALAPGSLAACPITAAVDLAGTDVIPASIVSAGFWDDGVKYVDGGVDLTCQHPERALACGGPICQCGSPDGDAGLDAGPSVDSGVACDGDAGDTAAPRRDLGLGPLDTPQPLVAVLDDQYLYVADSAVPLIHVFDLSTPGAPHELPPFVASSLADPDRIVTIRDIAISPPTRDFKRFMYAVDREQGTIMVYDVTDPVTANRSPMRRPHAELNPFQPEDRLGFQSPVVTVAFVRHDFPLRRVNGRPQSNSRSGILCNPNLNAARDSTSLSPADYGVFYRPDKGPQYTGPDQDYDLGPFRLRGIFAFATLANGAVTAIDVDDWDAPCRRPATMTGPSRDPAGIGQVDVGSLAVAQPDVTSPTDYDPYHAPTITNTEWVTDEIFFPVSAPHRARSSFILKDDLTTGDHVPYLPSTPSIAAINRPISLAGAGSESTPRLRPTSIIPGSRTGSQDLGVLFSLETPEVHFDQDWSVTYEGALPGFNGLQMPISTPDNYTTITLSQPGTKFCSKGVEDYYVGARRAELVNGALVENGRNAYDDPLEGRLLDYAQLNDEVLGVDDAFWRQADLPGADACWPPTLNASNPADSNQVESIAVSRHDYCLDAFGVLSDENPNRDFPILEAWDDHLVLGTFRQQANPTTGALRARQAYRVADAQQQGELKRMRCCFRSQATINVRGSAQWVVQASSLGVMNHIKRDASGRCVESCDANDVLLNGRVTSLPYDLDQGFAPFRDSPLAYRNPQFSFFIQQGRQVDTTGNVVKDATPDRDEIFRFQTRGSFSPLIINIAASTNQVIPQSMRFIDSLGQLAIVDGASQGLVLIDLSSVTLAHAPYF